MSRQSIKNKASPKSATPAALNRMASTSQLHEYLQRHGGDVDHEYEAEQQFKEDFDSIDTVSAATFPPFLRLRRIACGAA
jgi:hypothetical protein